LAKIVLAIFILKLYAAGGTDIEVEVAAKPHDAEGQILASI
jgi:hypothetical protein